MNFNTLDNKISNKGCDVYFKLENPSYHKMKDSLFLFKTKNTFVYFNWS